MIKLPFVMDAAPASRPAILAHLEDLRRCLRDLKAALETEGLYAPDGCAGVQDGETAVRFDRLTKDAHVLDTKDEIPW